MAKIKQTKKYTGRARKETIVAELTQKFDSSNGVVFADYKGLTHQQLENLKKELKTMDSTIVIAKNSLIKISLGNSKNFAEFKENEGLEAPTATLFIGTDMVEPLKKLQKLIKDAGLPKIKFGILEGQLLDESGVLKIASLPNRETLLAQFVGMLNSPIQGFVSGLNAIPQKFVMTLDAIAKSKPADSTPAPTAPSEPTATETSSEAPAAEESSETPAVEVAAPANEPASQPDAPITTDESADAGTETPAEAVKEEKTEEQPTESAEETQTDKPTEEKPETVDEGGEK